VAWQHDWLQMELTMAVAMRTEGASRPGCNRVLDPSTTGLFDDTRRMALARVMQEEARSPGSSGEFVYTRYGNPTVAETERTIGAMSIPMEPSPP